MMTVLILAYAFDCLMTLWVGTWQAGPPVSYQREPVCELKWDGLWQPELRDWCTFLGPARCQVRIEE